MKSTTMSRNFRNDGPSKFNIENERQKAAWSICGESWRHRDSLYQRATSYEEARIFALWGTEPEERLNHLKEEVKIRLGITKQEIFIIGELLLEAKKICQQEKIGFKDWIAEHFDFSYETANNLMNVFKQCFAQRSFAVKIPTSILYKISAPSFPEELRDCLFENGALTEMSNGRLKNLVEKYKEKGLEAVEDEINQLSRTTTIHRQIRNTYDQVENTLRLLDKYGKKVKFGENNNYRAFGFEDGVALGDPIAAEYQKILHSALVKAYGIVNEAFTEANEYYGEHWESVVKKAEIA